MVSSEMLITVRQVTGGDAPTCPLVYLHADAPPFLIIHGSLDTLVLAEDARHFADELRSASKQPVVYAELPGAHNFDLFHSLRFHTVTDAIELFVTDMRAPTWPVPASEHRAR